MDNQEIDSILQGLFFGEVDEKAIFPYPLLDAETRSDTKAMLEPVTDFLEKKVDSAKFEEMREIPKEIIEEIAALGILGMEIPSEEGGLGLGKGSYFRIAGEISGYDASLGVFSGAHQSIGYRALLNEGTPQQRKKWLPLLARGEKIAAFCLTEPSAGSDAFSLKTQAVENKDGSYTITGQKLWISNGGLADFYTVFCKTSESEVSAFIVEKGMEGLSFGEKEQKMGIQASETRALYLDKVRVPAENLIGEKGKGFKVAMNVLNCGRLTLSSGCTAGMKRMLKLITAHAVNRKQFGKSINNFGMIQDKMAKMAAKTYACESTVYMTIGNMERGMSNHYLESAACKIFASETGWEVMDMGLQIAAGCGYMKEYPYERMLRDMRINLIFEGTNEILRCFLALSGIKGPSEHMKELGKIADISTSLQSPLKSLGLLGKFASKRIERMVFNHALTQHHPKLQDWAVHFSSLLSAFSNHVENSLIKHGKAIIEKQLAQKRLADMSIQLYVMLSVISRTSSILKDKNVDKQKKQYSLHLANHACRDARYRFIANSKEMANNIDETVVKLAEQVSQEGGYGLDILDY